MTVKQLLRPERLRQVPEQFDVLSGAGIEPPAEVTRGRALPRY
jgi:hypothetical protein